MSRSRFAERFQQKVGQPPLAYLTWWRMVRAAAMLSMAGSSVKAVAQASGYRSGSAFGVAFRRALGVSPRGQDSPIEP